MPLLHLAIGKYSNLKLVESGSNEVLEYVLSKGKGTALDLNQRNFFSPLEETPLCLATLRNHCSQV